MNITRITDKTKNITPVRNLYETSFPENERRDLEDLIDENSEGMEFYSFYEDDKFIGILSLLSYRDLTHIMYLAVSEEYRSCGYGSKILTWLKEFKSSQRIIADLERIMPDAKNNDQRKRRNGFYIRNGFSPSGVCYTWREENYELYVHGGDFSEYEYKAFWKHFSDKNKDRK